ncbi:GNAT family N-acetyltransferase [Bacillus sp. ISL-47]|uniref:GNAT family N-acetyltransferase n=1 Tax=Bacillus sp. ISL-47 TaxID=2819130 RepID=UPI001BE9657E|nr:GNAT family N-acetyltransferase [Bacillus sp. ISL-47]MBT2690226.1 GNAT family N-acetyltransferase [Bacillus sp. ISL-47]MBT2709009.1 GNAT family N-acetyltransferase [Pseudomonas sp. ISL-84]
MILLKELTVGYAEKLLDFEQENRTYFEQFVPPREEGYYFKESVISSILEMQKSRNDNKYYLYLLINEKQQIAGRINVYNIDGETLEAEIGYRIGLRFTGMGYASEAVRLISRETKEVLGLKRLKALTLSFNGASSRVLEKNGFMEGETLERHLPFNGLMHDAKVYYKNLI